VARGNGESPECRARESTRTPDGVGTLALIVIREQTIPS